MTGSSDGNGWVSDSGDSGRRRVFPTSCKSNEADKSAPGELVQQIQYNKLWSGLASSGSASR
ncbi:hypothetical protein O9929_13625 [Vibrio lentus]|nr:hypothetical protein [Vibrio lentus]